MADKITNFEDYKKREDGEDIDIHIEDPYNFFNEEEREEYFQERQKETVQKAREEASENVSKSQSEPEEEADDDSNVRERSRRDVRSGHKREYDRASEEDYEEEYDEDEDDYEEDSEEDDSDDSRIRLFVRISSVVTGILILAILGIAFKVKVFDKYFAADPDEEVTVVSALPSGYVEKNDTVTVTAENLNLRTTPSSASSDTIVTAVSKGTQLKRIAVSEDGSWALVEYNGAQVYASMKYLE